MLTVRTRKALIPENQLAGGKGWQKNKNKKIRSLMSNDNSVRIAIEVSRYMRRLMRDLFRAGAGVDINIVAYLSDEEQTGVIDEFDIATDEWEWANAVLMLMRTLYGILENAENEME